MEVIKNSKETFVRLQQLIWNGGTDRQTDTQTDRQTHRQTDPCIELRYAQLIMEGFSLETDVQLTGAGKKERRPLFNE